MFFPWAFDCSIVVIVLIVFIIVIVVGISPSFQVKRCMHPTH